MGKMVAKFDVASVTLIEPLVCPGCWFPHCAVVCQVGMEGLGKMLRRQQAFTLLELMVTIAVLAILAGIALPSFMGTIRRNNLSTYTNELVASIALARSEAIRSTHGATLCAANATHNGCAAAADWNSNGWLVWVNNRADPAFSAAEDTVLAVRQANPAITLAANASKVEFDGRGRPSSALDFDLKIKDCPSSGDYRRTISINVSGQVSKQAAKC